MVLEALLSKIEQQMSNNGNSKSSSVIKMTSTNKKYRLKILLHSVSLLQNNRQMIIGS